MTHILRRFVGLLRWDFRQGVEEVLGTNGGITGGKAKTSKTK
jgi:hypothetical protein